MLIVFSGNSLIGNKQANINFQSWSLKSNDSHVLCYFIDKTPLDHYICLGVKLLWSEIRLILRQTLIQPQKNIYFYLFLCEFFWCLLSIKYCNCICPFTCVWKSSLLHEQVHAVWPLSRWSLGIYTACNLALIKISKIINKD